MTNYLKNHLAIQGYPYRPPKKKYSIWWQRFLQELLNLAQILYTFHSDLLYTSLFCKILLAFVRSSTSILTVGTTTSTSTSIPTETYNQL